MPYAATEPIRQPIEPARATNIKLSPEFTPANNLPVTIITPARGITISLGRGIQQLSITIASTIPARPAVTYRLVINVVIESVRCANKKPTSFALLCICLSDTNIFCAKGLEPVVQNPRFMNYWKKSGGGKPRQVRPASTRFLLFLMLQEP